MNLLRTSFWSGISSAFKILSGIIITKIIATVVGPTGVALLGNFNNVTGMLTTFANGGITSGVTKYIAEFDVEEEKLHVVSHAVRVNLVCSFIIGITVIIFNKTLTLIAFGGTKYSSVFILFGITVVFYGLNSTMSAVLNGYKYIKSLIVSSIFGSVSSVVLAIVITIRFGLFGAIINTMIAQVFIFFINVMFVRRLKILSARLLTIKFSRSLLWKLFKYGTMSLVTAIVVPMSFFLIRNYIYKHFSPNEAGFVQGVWSISSAYLALITTTMSIYYLPTLSSIKDGKGIQREILNAYKLLLPLAMAGGIAIYISRDLIIHVLYTPTFLPMKEYFVFQIIGDAFKIASFILAHIMIAKAMTWWYIASEVIFSSLYVVFSFLFMQLFGSIGVTYAYTLNYFLYLVFLSILFRGYLFGKEYQNAKA